MVRMAAMAEREYGAYFRAAQWLGLPMDDKVLIMICFRKREQWVEATTRCLEASRVTACPSGHASQPPQAL